MILRGFAILVGLALLAAACHATITHSGGYGTPHAYLTIAIAAGVGVGALAIGAAWSQRRRALSVAILLALVCGELFGLVMTGERLIDAREAKLAPVQAAQAARSQAASRVDELKAALSDLSSPRLAAALEAKRVVDDTIATKAAERGCAANCRKLLEAQRDRADSEVAIARAAFDDQRRKLRDSLAAATAELDRLPPVMSANPLADRLGVAPWILDLTVAALGSIAANGLAACLLAFGAHTPRRRPTIEGAPLPAGAVADPKTTLMIEHAGLEREHVAQFLMATIEPDPRATMSLRDLVDRYREFVTDTGHEALARERLGQQLGMIATAIGLEAQAVEGDYVLRGARMKIR